MYSAGGIQDIPNFLLLTISSSVATNISLQQLLSWTLLSNNLTGSVCWKKLGSISGDLRGNMASVAFSAVACLFFACCSRAMPTTLRQEAVNDRPVIGKWNMQTGDWKLMPVCFHSLCVFVLQGFWLNWFQMMPWNHLAGPTYLPPMWNTLSLGAAEWCPSGGWSPIQVWVTVIDHKSRNWR